MTLRHIEKVRTMLKLAMGIDVSYAYEDLIFPSHEDFLLRFDDEAPSNYYCHFHRDCSEAQKKRLLASLEVACRMHECTITPRETFHLEPQGDNVQVHFA
ncbi:MAG: hypothetical protein JXX29_03450 [Deltaproteobacteria bacterium]|nr:hypothetical protein [Deltaproteobacteria bacterium]MBN2670698.1 hypothetical protein [Deltaproteobacteria bacterium]